MSQLSSFPKNPVSTQQHSNKGNLSLFPALDSIQEVVNQVDAQIPKEYRNTVISLLGTLQNTLLKQFRK